MILLLATLLASFPQNEPLPSATEFAQLMKDSFGKFKCVSFIVEGEQISLENGKPRAGRTPRLFQTHYAFQDGRPPAGLLDLYEFVAPDPPSHRSRALLDRSLELSDRPRALDPINPKLKQPQQTPGASFSLNITYSPQIFFYLWYFPALTRLRVPTFDYSVLGWEEVAARRCLKVKLGIVPGGLLSPDYLLFWIDIERGGHPLNVERYHEEHLIYRVADIELMLVQTVEREAVWLPVRGTVDVFGSAGNPQATATSRETYRVVTGSVQINLDLPDDVFRVHTKPRRELGNAIALRAQNPIEKQLSKEEPFKTDPASMQARLDAKMVEADRQAKEIEASSPARTSWGGVNVAQAVLAVLGVGLIGTAGFWVWRRSR